jgi:hypothetical protein
MPSRYNEGKALDAVIRHIETRENSVRGTDGRSPDDLLDLDHRRRVDYVVSIGDRLYAFEHTGIEPFQSFIERGHHNGALFEPLAERFGQRADAEYWELYVPVEASAGLTAAQVRSVQKALVDWIDANAATTSVRRYGDRFQMNKTPIPGIPFPATLVKWSFTSIPDIPDGQSPLSGRFSVRPVVSGNIETARVERLGKACDDKFPKLAAWKRDDGARTILVLEENDISLTNHQSVAEALTAAEAGRTDLPDEVYVVGTGLDLWFVTCLRRDGKTYYDDGERFHEVNPATLSKLTKR